MGGDCIGSDLVYLSTGYDFLKMVIQIACGEIPNIVPTGEQHIAQVKFLFNQTDIEELEKIKKINPDSIYRISNIAHNNIEQVSDSSTRLGYYILIKNFKQIL